MRVFRTLGGKAIIKETDPLATQARILSWPPGRRCVPYMESGRQRWLSGTLDISGDLSGCNGPCPGTPLANGDPSAALAVQGAATLRELAPPSGFTGKLHLMVQALYGTKRTDMQSAGNGEIMVSDVLFGHSWEQSTILYTDADGVYWLLQLGGMETATIQKWAPCSEAFDASTPINEAYRLSLCKPSGVEVALSCTGTESDIGEPFANGWHATSGGEAGHIVVVESVMVEGDEHEFLKTRLCSFVLSDSGDQQGEGQSWEEYVESRFSVDFSVVYETDLFRIWYLWRIQRPNYQTGLHSTVLRDGTGAGGDIVTDVSDAPIYCIYDASDTLSVVSYSFSMENLFVEVETNWPFCGAGDGSRAEYTHKNISGGFSLNGYAPPDTAGGQLFREYEKRELTNLGGSGTDCDVGLRSDDLAATACEDGAMAEWDSFYGAHYPTPCFEGGSWVPAAEWGCGTYERTYLEDTKKHYSQQILLIPFGHHEAVHLHALEATSCFRSGLFELSTHQPVAVTKLLACDQSGSEGEMTVSWTIPFLATGLPPDRTRKFGLDWNRTVHSYARHDPGTLRQEYEDTLGTVSCDTFPFVFEEGEDEAPDWWKSLEETWFTRYDNNPQHFWPANVETCVLYENEMSYFYTWYQVSGSGANFIRDLESYHHGHRLAWFTGDKSVEAHDGYADFVDDGCFVGAS